MAPSPSDTDMKALPLVTDPDPRLKQVASLCEAPIGVKLAEQARRAMGGGGLGIAANQVGHSGRWFGYDLRDGGGFRVLHNPTIIDHSEAQITEAEGCLSLPGRNFDVPRFEECVVSGLDINFRPIVVSGRRLAARLFQHEIDHLDGLLISERWPEIQKRVFP